MTTALQRNLSRSTTRSAKVRTSPQRRPSIRTAAAEWKTIQACQRGDRNAWDTLIRRYEQTIHQFAYSLCHNHNDTDDITSQVFIRLYEKINHFRNEAPFTSWLYRITYHAYIDMCVRDPSRLNVSLDEQRRYSGRDGLLHLADPAPSPEARLLLAEYQTVIHKALHHLPKGQRTMIELYHLNNKTYEEIAALMDLPLGTVRSRLWRARRMLRERLSD